MFKGEERKKYTRKRKTRRTWDHSSQTKSFKQKEMDNGVKSTEEPSKIRTKKIF